MKTAVLFAIIGVVAVVGVAGAAVASEPVADAVGLSNLYKWAHQHQWKWHGEGSDMPYNYDYNYSYDYDTNYETCPNDCPCNLTQVA